MSIGKSSLKEGLHTPPSPLTAIRSNTSTLPFFGGLGSTTFISDMVILRVRGCIGGVPPDSSNTQTLHCMEYLLTFRPNMAQMEVNILYMEHMGYSSHIKSHSLYVENHKHGNQYRLVTRMFQPACCIFLPPSVSQLQQLPPKSNDSSG